MEKDIIKKEFTFSAVRSSGAGGQHVNKTSSKVVLTFDIVNSEGLREQQKALLINNLSPRLTKDNVLILSCEESRSQFRNKAMVIERLFAVLKEGLIKPTVRKRTRPSRSSIFKNKANKKRQSEKKELRRKPKI